MGIQTNSQILPYKEIAPVGPVPKEYGLWIDTRLAVSSHATNPADARSLIQYLLRPESNKVWVPRGMERFQ
jgi:ABC-type Fe3+ transport system substrate-binding protein